MAEKDELEVNTEEEQKKSKFTLKLTKPLIIKIAIGVLLIIILTILAVIFLGGDEQPDTAEAEEQIEMDTEPTDDEASENEEAIAEPKIEEPQPTSNSSARLAAIAGIVNEDAKAEEAKPEEQAEEPPEIDQLKSMLQENSELHQRINDLEAELARKKYIERTNQILQSKALEENYAKRVFEKPLDIELEPKWGNFKENVPDKVNSPPTSKQ